MKKIINLLLMLQMGISVETWAGDKDPSVDESSRQPNWSHALRPKDRHRDMSRAAASAPKNQEPVNNPFDEPILAETFTHAAPDWGTFYVEVIDFHEPANYSVFVNVSVLCKDQRPTKSTLLIPKKEVLARHQKLCSARSTFDEKTKILTLHTTRDEGDGDSVEETCRIQGQQEFELQRICAKWAVKEN